MSVTLEIDPCSFHFSVGAEITKESNQPPDCPSLEPRRSCSPAAVPPHLHFDPETISPQRLQNPIRQNLGAKCWKVSEKHEKERKEMRKETERISSSRSSTKVTWCSLLLPDHCQPDTISAFYVSLVLTHDHLSKCLFLTLGPSPLFSLWLWFLFFSVSPHGRRSSMFIYLCCDFYHTAKHSITDRNPLP